MEHTQSACNSSGHLRRRLTRAVLALCLVAGTMAMTATRVEAATQVLACFESNESQYGPAGLPVWLQVWEGGWNWRTIDYGVLSDWGGVGCVWFNVPSGYEWSYLQVKINNNITTFGIYHWGETSAHGSWTSPGYGLNFLYGMVFSSPGAFAW